MTKQTSASQNRFTSTQKRKDQIESAYRVTGGNAGFYDGMMTYSTFLGKLICRTVWNMDGEKNSRYISAALSGIPDDLAAV
jgi:hypothetical protein